MADKKKLKDFQDLLLCCCSLWSWHYDKNLRLMGSNCPDIEKFPVPLKQFREACKPDSNKLLPAVFVSDTGLAWAGTVEKDPETIRQYYMIGPVRIADQRKDYPESMPGNAADVPGMDIREFSRYASMLHKVLTNETIAAHSLIPGKIKSREGNVPNILLRLQDKIRNGDLDYKDLIIEVLTDHQCLQELGAVTIESAKNVAHISIDMCCKAALESGLSQKTVSALYDSYLPKIKSTDKWNEVAQLCNALMYRLIWQVRSTKGRQNYSEPVQSCCNYIEEHISGKLTLKSLAKQIGYSPDHLSKKFKQEVGEPIKDYVLRSRIHYAQLLLTTTIMSIGDIADKLSFCSSSHFTRVFRCLTHQTPTEYRLKYNHMV